MREYAVARDVHKGEWMVIYRDDYEETWYVEASGMTETIARSAVKGLNA